MSERTVNFDGAVGLASSLMKTPQDWVAALHLAGARPVVLDGAHDHGFMADQVYVIPGNSGKQLSPDDVGKILDSHQPPVLDQGMAVQVFKHLGQAGLIKGRGTKVAGDVVQFPGQSLPTAGPSNPPYPTSILQTAPVVGMINPGGSRNPAQIKYGMALFKQQNLGK